MLRTKAVAVFAVALAMFAGPLAAAPAQASTDEPLPCEIFAPPYDRACGIADQGVGVVISVYCIVFPSQTICN